MNPQRLGVRVQQWHRRPAGDQGKDGEKHGVERENAGGAAQPENAQEIRTRAVVEENTANEKSGENKEQIDAGAGQPERAFKDIKRAAVFCRETTNPVAGQDQEGGDATKAVKSGQLAGDRRGVEHGVCNRSSV